MSNFKDDPQPSRLAFPSRSPDVGGLRLLSLDGGGIRGLSELCILDQLMARLSDGKPDKQPRPCDVFHMIAGTSTGGLIAIMLGRLRMTVRDCIDAYSKFAKDVFSDRVSWLSFQDGRFKASNLERAVKAIVSDQAQGEMMLDDRQDACKVFVCAVATASVNHVRRLRTYDESTIGECKIWEAARATSAAPTFFEPAEITINGTKERFVDGAIGFNNPAWELYTEARAVFPHAAIDCLVSIGTGSAVRGSLKQPKFWETKIPKNVINALKHVAVNCERNHELMLQQFQDQPDTYFRFNVDAGLEQIGLEEWTKLSEVKSMTIDYLAGFEMRRRIEKAATLLQNSLKDRRQPSTNPIPEALPNVLLSSNVEVDSKTNADVSSEQTPKDHGAALERLQQELPFRRHREPEQLGGSSANDRPRGDSKTLEAFLKKLNVDQSSIYNVRESKTTRHQGTCEWIHAKEEYQRWHDGQGVQILMLVAPPGRGKSTLAKYLLEELKTSATSRDKVILEYFCKESHDHDGDNADGAIAVTKSLLFQFLEQHGDCFHAIEERHRRLLERDSPLTLEGLWDVLSLALKSPGIDEIFCVVDGLDECGEKSQDSLWRAIEKNLGESSSMNGASVANLHILLTSRPTALAKRIGCWKNVLEIQRPDVDPDITKYVNYRVDRMTKAELLPSDVSGYTKDFLDVGAEGMFLWANLSLNQLEDWEGGISYQSLSLVLKEVPKDVKGLYARAVERIQLNPDRIEQARRVLEILLFSVDSLSIKGLALAVSGWPQTCTTHQEAEGHFDFRFEDTAKRLCGSLITVVQGRVQLCHHTAGQFLRDEALKYGLRFDPEAAHSQLAQICLQYLLLEDIEIPRRTLTVDESKYPLLSYALSHWPLHVRSSGDSVRKYRTLLQRFLHVSNLRRLKACLDRWPLFFADFPPEHFDAEIAAHALVFYGLFNVLKLTHFLDQRPDSYDVNPGRILTLDTTVDAPNKHGDTPLIESARAGSLQCVQVLLDLGADVEARGQLQFTALHHAAMHGNLKVVKLLIPRVATLDPLSKDGFTPLMLADNLDVVTALLDAGANMEGVGEHGKIPLKVAALRRQVEKVRVLIDKGASIDRADSRGWTPVIAAASSGSVQVLRLLLDRGANVNITLPTGQTALHIAAGRGSTECVELLARNAINLDAKAGSKWTPLTIAAAQGHADVVRLLLKLGVDPGTTASSVNTEALVEAVAAGHLEVVQILLEAGNDPALSHGPYVALHEAALFGHDEILKCLVSHRAPIEAVGPRGQTPLIMAALMRRYGCMQILLDADANPTLRDEYGKSAFDYATNSPVCEARMMPWRGTYQSETPADQATMQHAYVRSQFVQFQRQAVDGPARKANADPILRGLLLLGEDELARTMTLLSNKHGWSDLECDACCSSVTILPFRICTACTWDLCETCFAGYKDPRQADDRLCDGHEMILITEAAWDELEPRNDPGPEKKSIVLQRWLADMRQRFDVSQHEQADEEQSRMNSA